MMGIYRVGGLGRLVMRSEERQGTVPEWLIVVSLLSLTWFQ